MQITGQMAEVRHLVRCWHKQGQKVAFVPTMGNLHEGHLQLVRRGRQLAERVVVSIFVNPLQFGPNEDYGRYPRTLNEDSAVLRTAGVDLLFTPSVEAMYPRGQEAQTRVQVPELGRYLCGASRPGHFDGVSTVVNKLFNLVQPDVAIFGEKDFQQLQIIRRMVADLALPIQILGEPTVRERDGLAKSSRNGYLNEMERRRAPALYQILRQIAEAIRCGQRDYRALEQQGQQQLQEAGFKPDYLQVCNAASLAPAQESDKTLVICAAAVLGRTRLIDNLQLVL